MTPTARQTLTAFYEAVRRRDISVARKFLADDLVFEGLFETYPNPESYLAALTGLLGITTSLEPRVIIGEGEDAAIFFDLVTTAPAAATTLVAEWHRVRDGKIFRVRSAFDGRPFAAMFGSR
jgi:ketosteroid isomerase-like protein